MQKQYERLMRKCMVLARKGEGRVSPNPLVGSIVFDDDFRIISSGYHEKYGENHAERNAILNSKEDVRGKNLIVNLEPCSHYGKTPPCADLIIEKGIKRVIIGMKDVNPIVSGNGIKKLEEAGIEVITGVLEEECRELNEVFIKNQTKKMPFVVIKTATTLDGKIATSSGNSKWITGEASRKEVQKLRNRYDAILTSSSTVKRDNPSMTCRMKNGRNPIRIVFDTNLTTAPESKIYNFDNTPVYIITKTGIDKKEKLKYGSNVEIIECDIQNGRIDANKALKLLYNKGVRSILVEAGGTLNGSFVRACSADKLIQFIAPKILSDSEGISFVTGEKRLKIDECELLKIKSVKKIKDDIIITGQFP